MSAVTNRGRPIAATSTSAVRTIAARFLRAAVADGHGRIARRRPSASAAAPSACRRSRCGRGRRRACPAVSIPSAASSSCTPAGVQGRNRGRPWTIRPTFSGWKASTSFSGSTASCTRQRVDLRRQRRLHEDAVDAASAFSAATSSSSSACDVVAGSRWTVPRKPAARRPVPCCGRRRRSPGRRRRAPRRGAASRRSPRRERRGLLPRPLAELARDPLAVDDPRGHGRVEGPGSRGGERPAARASMSSDLSPGSGCVTGAS